VVEAPELLHVERDPRSDGSGPVLRVTGEVDLFTLPDLADAIGALPQFATTVVVDMCEVTMLCAAGLDLLARAARSAAQRNAIFRVMASAQVARVVELGGLDEDQICVHRCRSARSRGGQPATGRPASSRA
jgi:anti-anti-sigma factor